MTSFGDRLKKYRREKGLTQQELADLLGVSNKTISRWESEGGYPDVSMLVPLARVLGVTVDDLLDGERPVRTLTKADWQNLLSFGFALGGGVLFFLFDLFMPMVVCYLAYLGCMAYGVYLQKYYSYQSRWFFLSNAIMNLSVNASLTGRTISALLAGRVTMTLANADDLAVRLLWWISSHLFFVQMIAFLLAAVITMITHQIVLHWSQEMRVRKEKIQLRLGLPTSFRKVIPILIPAAYCLFWLCFHENNGELVWFIHHQTQIYIALTVVSFVLVLMLFRKKRWQGWRLGGLMLTAVCAASRWAATANQMLWTIKNSVLPYREMTGYPENYIRFLAPTTAMFVILGILAVIWLLACLVRVEKKTMEE